MFADELTKYLGKSRSEHRPTEIKRVGDSGRTPVFIDGDKSQLAKSPQAVIAVVHDHLGRGIGDFAYDGAEGIAERKIGSLNVVIKVYRVTKQGNIGSLVASYQPETPSEWHRDPIKKDWLNVIDLMPTRKSFSFDEAQALAKLIEHGAMAPEAENEIIPLLRLGGKVCFIGSGAKPTVAEVGPSKTVNVFQAQEPEDLDDPNRVKRRRSSYQ